MRRILLLVFTLLLVNTLFLAHTATATDYLVYPDGQGGTHATIAEAVAAVTHGDRILLGTGVFSGPGNRDITVFRDIEIRPEGINGSAVIDCGGSASEPHRAFYLEYSSARLTGLVIRGGHHTEGGAVFVEEGNNTIAGCIFEGNQAETEGGALSVTEEAVLTLTNSIFADNHAGTHGGALMIRSYSQVAAENCTFVLNGATSGGHAYLSEEGTATFTGSILAWGAGGGVIADYYASGWSVDCCDVYGNRGGNAVQGSDNLSVDPQLCDPAAGHYMPVRNSPMASDPQCGALGALPAHFLWTVPVYGLKADGSGMFEKIQDAMDGVPDGAVIALEDGIYSGYHNRNLNPHGKALTVRSRNGDPDACRIDAQASFDEPARVLIINSGEGQDTVFEGLRFDNGWTPGWGALVYLEGAVAPVFENCVFDAGTAYEGTSVAIAAAESETAAPRFLRCAFQGSVYAENYLADVEECDFTGSDAGLRLWDCPGGTIRNSDFHDLTTVGVGAAIYLARGGEQTFTLSGNTFTNCRAFRDAEDEKGRGGAMELAVVNSSVISHCQFEGCWAEGLGGDIRATGGLGGDYHLLVEHCVFNGTGQTTEVGGSISLQALGTPAVLDSCQWQGYRASDRGGILFSMSEVQLRDCVLASSTATYGGAIYAWENSLDATGCTFRDNEAVEGGALYAMRNPLSLSSSRFEENRADRGGAVFVEKFENYGFYHDMTEVVFWHNLADLGGAAIFMNGDHLTMDHCTVHWNEITSAGAELGQICLGRWVDLDLQACLITGADTTPAVTEVPDLDIPPTVTAACTNVWGNTWGDWTGPLAGLQGDGNISADPLYCDPLLAVLTLDAASPCSRWNSDCGEWIGALRLACGDLSAAQDGPATDGPIPARMVQVGAFPNPFNPRTTVSFALPGPATVELVIHDLTGKKVATLARGRFAAGRHEQVWTGRDDAGRNMPSGVYLCRLSTPWGAQTAKLALVR